jgi:hypothetical protein
MRRPAKLLNRSVLFVLVLLSGCGSGDFPRRVVTGKVQCNGKSVDRGTLRFMPIVAGSPLPLTTAIIQDGQYRIDIHGGIPLGKYRVEVYAKQLTGKTIPDRVGRMMEQTVDIGPRNYAGNQSPLVADITADSNDQMDFTIP